MSHPPNVLRYCLTIALALALVACAPQAPLPDANKPSQEQRLTDLEQRVDKLEARTPIPPPYRSKAEIQAQISELETERSKLLIHYTAQHPAIRDIDRELAILNDQLKMLE
jgi:septal ring factor EnvC (AmiA/AmiB activator)